MDNKTHIIQSVLMDKNKYELIDALLYILKNKYKADKIDESDNYYRFRQVEPLILDKKGFDKYKTIKGLEEGTKIIIAYK
jgi:hypothetical protein